MVLRTRQSADPVALAGAALALCACTEIAGLDALTFGSSSGADATAPASTASTGGAGGDGGAPSSGGTGGEAGAGDCGDGTVQANEECDDENDVSEDGCSDCVVDCAERGAFKLANDHCYWGVAASVPWNGAVSGCQDAGAAPVAFSDAFEYISVVGQIPNVTSWTGGNDLAIDQVFVWSNGEVWFDDDGELWATDFPHIDSGRRCVLMLPGEAMAIANYGCDTNASYACERTPAGL